MSFKRAMGKMWDIPMQPRFRSACKKDSKVIFFRNRSGTDRLRCFNIVIDDCLQYLYFSVIQSHFAASFPIY